MNKSLWGIFVYRVTEKQVAFFFILIIYFLTIIYILIIMGYPRGVIVKPMDCVIVVSEFELQSRYNV